MTPPLTPPGANDASNALRGWEILRTLIFWVVGLYFVYAAAFKIYDPALFATDIKRYQLMPLWSINAQALLMPWWEMAAGFAMLLPNWRRAGGVIVFLMLCVFTLALLSAAARGLDIRCGCTGKGSGTVASSLARNAGMLLTLGLALCFRPRAARPVRSFEADLLPTAG